LARNIPIIPSGDKQTGCPWAQGETCEKLRGRRVRSWRFGSCGVLARDALVNFGDRDVVIASGAVDCLVDAVVHAVLAGHPGGESGRVRTRIAPRGTEVPVGFSEVVRGEISSANGSGSGSRSSQGGRAATAPGARMGTPRNHGLARRRHLLPSAPGVPQEG
jgi:hypothetical protein